MELAAAALTAGYKYTFERGLTLEIVTRQRYLMLGDAMTPPHRVRGWRPQGHINVGWSF